MEPMPPLRARRGGATSRRAGESSDAIRITTAAANPLEEHAARQRRYLISMAVRTLCFVGALAVGGGWLRWVLIAGAVFLPYVSVVAATTSSRGDDGFILPELEDQSRHLSGGPQNAPDAP